MHAHSVHWVVPGANAPGSEGIACVSVDILTWHRCHNVLAPFAAVPISAGPDLNCCYWWSHISRGHSVCANAVAFDTFSGFSQLLVRCTKIPFPGGGGVCVYFLKSGQRLPTPPPTSENSSLGENWTFTKEAQNWRPIPGTQTCFWPLPHPPTPSAPGGGGGAACKKRPFQICVDYGGLGGHIFEHTAGIWTMHGTEQCTGDQ